MEALRYDTPEVVLIAIYSEKNLTKKEEVVSERMSSFRCAQPRHFLSAEAEETKRDQGDTGTEPKPDEMDWDGFGTTLDNRLQIVGQC